MTDKNTPLEVAVRRTRQSVKLLAEQPDFKGEIQRLREKWGIPKEGFKEYEQFNRWEIAFNENNRDYQQVKYPEFASKFKKEPDYHKRLKEFSNKAPNNELRHDIAMLIKKQKLSPLWVNGLRGYLLRNFMPVFAGLIIEISDDPLTGMPILKLIIQEDTSIKDVLAGWSEIKRYQENLPYWRQKKSQPIQYFERNKRVYELKQSGKSSKEIAKILTTELNIQFDYTQVVDFIRSYEKYLHKAKDES